MLILTKSFPFLRTSIVKRDTPTLASATLKVININNNIDLKPHRHTINEILEKIANIIISRTINNNIIWYQE